MFLVYPTQGIVGGIMSFNQFVSLSVLFFVNSVLVLEIFLLLNTCISGNRHIFNFTIQTQ